MATKKKKAVPKKKKRTLSVAQKAALARGRAALAKKRKPARKTTRKKTLKTSSVVVVTKPKPRRKKSTVNKSTVMGEYMAKRKTTRRKSVSRMASGAGRKAGAFLKQSDAIGMLKNAGLAVAGGVGAGFLASKVPIADKRLKSALPIVAGIVLSGTLGRRNRTIKGVAEGMVILGAVSLFKSLAPNVPMLAGDGPQYYIPAGYPYNPQQQIEDNSGMGESVRIGQVVDMGMDEYYSPADL